MEKMNKKVKCLLILCFILFELLLFMTGREISMGNRLNEVIEDYNDCQHELHPYTPTEWANPPLDVYDTPDNYTTNYTIDIDDINFSIITE